MCADTCWLLLLLYELVSGGIH